MIAALLVHAAVSMPPCGPGNFYDPGHQICAPYAPSVPQPGYPGFGGDQACGGSGHYDPTHGVCGPGYPSVLPPFYQGERWASAQARSVAAGRLEAAIIVP